MYTVNYDVLISNHGRERVLERTHCKRNCVETFIKEVWLNGKGIDSYNTKSATYQYLKNVIKVGGADRALRVKGNTLYIFNKRGTVFVTCYDIPQKVIQSNNKRRTFA